MVDSHDPSVVTYCPVCCEYFCNKRNCRQIFDKIVEEKDQQWERDRRMAVRSLAMSRCKDSDDLPRSRTIRWWYTFKGLVCLRLRRIKGLDYSESILDCAAWDIVDHSHPDAPIGATGWTELAIGRGVFANWYVDIYSNTSY